MGKDPNIYHYIGNRIPRTDALSKALGTAKYTADLKTKNMLIGKALFTKYPHAYIKNIDVSRANRIPGVAAIITAKDLPGSKTYGVFAADKPVLAENKVRYMGDPIAFVAAIDEKTAIQALSMITVDYEILPVINDPREAMKENSILIHKNHPCAIHKNIMLEMNLTKGDAEKAFRDAEIIIENDYKTPMIEHAYLEPDCCIAEYELGSKSLVITAPQQAVYSSLGALATVFNLPQGNIRVISPFLGGGFGGKEDSCLDVAVIAGLLAMKTDKPVYVELSAEEVFRITGKRHPAYIHHRLAATKHGKITGIDVQIILDKGAYASMSGLRSSAHALTQRTIMYAGSVYSIPNASVKAFSVFTNNPYSTAMRGFGAPQVHFAMEGQVDELATILNVNPIEIRRINMLNAGDKTIFGQEIKESMGIGISECLTLVEQELKKDSLIQQTNNSIQRGKGIAAFMYGIGMPIASEGALCYINILPDGSVHAAVSTSEMGQGSNTVYAQIIAETLHVDINRIYISYSDTYITPNSGPTVASRSTTFVGNALINACETLINKLKVATARHFSCDPEEIAHKGELYFQRDREENSISFENICACAKNYRVFLNASGYWFPPEPSFDENGQGEPMHAYMFGVHGIELIVNKKTGEIDILKSVLACDVGKAINPMAVEGQLEGGAIMGIGWSLMEEIIIKDGIVVNDSLKDFIIPSIKDMPDLITFIVEKPNKAGPYGAKGAGEPPLIATAPAIRSALFNATGVWLNTIPFTQERIINEIKNKEKKESVSFE